MTDRKALADQNETPEDVATLYSWANLHGAKYRDFSASRAQTREKARQRVQDAIEEERRRAREEAEALKAAEAHQRATDALRAAESARQAELAAQQAAQSAQAAQAAQRQAGWQQQNLQNRYSAAAYQDFGAAPAPPFYPAQPLPSQPFPAAAPQPVFAPPQPAFGSVASRSRRCWDCAPRGAIGRKANENQR